MCQCQVEFVTPAKHWPFKINILQEYAPTVEKRYVNKVEIFYEQLDTILQDLKKNEVTVMGDFNATIELG